MSPVYRYFRNIGKGFWTVLIGMRITMKHLFTPAVTIQYPDARMPIPERGRNRLYVNMDDCIGCNQCAMACPVDCISVETAKSLPTEDLGMTSTGQKKRLWVTKFDIDFAKCCYCGLCVPPCPTECIYMTDVYEFSEYDRGNLNYSFITLSPEEAAGKVAQAKAAEAEAAAKKAAAAAAAAAQKAAQPQTAAQPVVPAKPNPSPAPVQQPPQAKAEAPGINPPAPGTPVAPPQDESKESSERPAATQPCAQANTNPKDSSD
jgi:NADH-quinone oxidoreductase subunit I